MADITLFVNYFVARQQNPGHQLEGNVHSLFPAVQESVSESQLQVVKNFLASRNQPFEVVANCVENQDKRSTKWPQLERAIRLCQERNAGLIIAELGTLTNNDGFVKTLLSSNVEFYCCDQPFVNKVILEALHKHSQVQKKLHGKLIREGLKMTSAKSGNPNAAEVISKVNKPKIDAAIIFAFLLKPIVTDYRRKGFSQRQMVKTLNEEGFTAPEGGKWVLSQLQKVLDRVRLNEIATEAKEHLEEFLAANMNEAEIAEQLTAKGISSIKRTAWDEVQVKKLLVRHQQIKEIESINRFTLDLIPLIHKFRSQNLTSSEMLTKLAQADLPMKQADVEVA